MTITVDLAWFHHRREEDLAAHSTAVEGRTAEGTDLRPGSLTVEPIDEVGFKGCVGRKIERIFGGNGGGGARLLLALQPGLDPADPKASSPGIVNDVVDVTNGALREGIGDAPSRATVAGRVNVDLIASSIVEVLSPKYCAAWDSGDVQGACPTGDRVSALEFEDSPGRSAKIAPGTAATSPPDGRTASA